jgi:hypothetical protein
VFVPTGVGIYRLRIPSVAPVTFALKFRPPGAAMAFELAVH